MLNRRINKISFIAIMSGISFVLMIFPVFSIFPSASFLQIEFSIIPILLVGNYFGTQAAIIVLLVRSLLKLLLGIQNIGTIIGLPINIIIVLSVLLTLTAFKYNNVSWILSTIIQSFFSVVINVFYAIPLYKSFFNFDIEKIFGLSTYIFYYIVPFSIVQSLIWFIIFFLSKRYTKQLFPSEMIESSSRNLK